MSAPKDPEKYELWKQRQSQSKKGKPSKTKGKPLSEEHKAKVSASLKGRKTWNKGIFVWSDEDKAKMSEERKGRKHTEEAKAKISEGMKGKRNSLGHAPHNKGVPMTEEQKSRFLKSQIGRKQSEEEKEKRAKALRGKKRTPETSERLSKALKGKKRSDEAKANMSKARKGIPSGRKGAKHTPEAKAKMAKATNAQWERWTEEQRAAKLEILRKSTEDIKKSSIEEIYAEKLDTQGIIYERQKRIGWYRVDFYVPSENRVIEIVGCYWHCCIPCGYENAHVGKREADEKRYEYLLRKGYVLDIIWEHDIPRRR